MRGDLTFLVTTGGLRVAVGRHAGTGRGMRMRGIGKLDHMWLSGHGNGATDLMKKWVDKFSGTSTMFLGAEPLLLLDAESLLFLKEA